MNGPIKEKVRIAFSFLIALILMIIAYAIAKILPGQDAVAWNTDSIDQMAAIGTMLARHIKNGDNLFYSWETSMGQNTALLYAFCAYSPMTILYLMIPDVYTATLIGMALKVAFSSIIFYIFLCYGLKWKGEWNVFFALCYAMSGFSMEYLLTTNLLDAMYLLPLIMWALLRSIRDRKFVLLSIIYAISFIIQFYMAFLI